MLPEGMYISINTLENSLAVSNKLEYHTVNSFLGIYIRETFSHEYQWHWQ